MRSGLPLGRVAGVPIRVGVSWLVVVPLVGVALFAGIEPALGPFGARLGVAAVGTLLLFGSVVLHEVGHVVAAHRRGVVVERVMVFLFGGYSEMDLESASPSDDVAVSLAGPIASGLVAVATMAAALATPEWSGARRTLAILGLVNIGVALFNLLPGFPLDGGRMLRAGLIGTGLDRRTAGVVTARIGIGLGVAAVAAGITLSILGEASAMLVTPVGGLLVVIAAAAHPRAGDGPESTPTTLLDKT